ncbi:hypothetical protein Q5P01_024788 [Channa striata]|uniref:Uncharacterized protein n=1 Tax=Channa striata TaxID=64152 RepID=A0AA88IRK3_CHASR|nr:hypothetical protein Q5P01_024788 [Channa striata]
MQIGLPLPEGQSTTTSEGSLFSSYLLHTGQTVFALGIRCQSDTTVDIVAWRKPIHPSTLRLEAPPGVGCGSNTLLQENTALLSASSSADSNRLKCPGTTA